MRIITPHTLRVAPAIVFQFALLNAPPFMAMESLAQDPEYGIYSAPTYHQEALTSTGSKVFDAASQPVTFATASRRPNSFLLQSAQAGSTTDIDNLRVVDLDTGNQIYSNSFSVTADATNNLELLYWPQGGESTTNYVQNGSMTRVVGGKLRLETTGFGANGSGGYESHSEAEWASVLPRNFLVEFEATRLQWAGHFLFHLFRKETNDSLASAMIGGALSSTRTTAKRQDVLRMAASGSQFQQYGVITNWNGTQGWAVAFPSPPGSLMNTHRLGVSLSNSTVSFYLNGALLNSADISEFLDAEAAPVVSIPPPAIGYQGTPFSYTIAASPSPSSYGATGLPEGLSLDTSSGVITGVPTESGLFTVELSASNGGGTGTATLFLGINSDHPSAPVITGPSSAKGEVGSIFSLAASANNNPAFFAAIGLPPDVRLLAYGAFTGKPQSEGVYRAMIAASNAFGTGVAELLITVEPEQPPAISTAFIDVGMVSAYVYTDNGNSPLLGGSFGLGYFGSFYDFGSKTREQILSDVTWMNGRLEQGGLIDAANPGQFYVDAFQSTIPSGTPLYAFLSTGPTIDSGNWFVLGGTPEGGWLAPDPDGLSSTVLDLGFVGNSILAGTSGWRFASGGPVSTGDESIVFVPAGSVDSDGDGLTDEWENGFGRYQIVEGEFTWNQAKIDAEVKGGHLATVGSMAEWSRITAFLDEGPDPGFLWLGGTDAQTEGLWQWIDGTTWSFSAWASGEPNDSSGEDRLAMLPATNRYVWNDLHGENDPYNYGRFGYLLEFGYPTDPMKADTDGDGFNDSIESHFRTDPNNASLTPNNAQQTGGVRAWGDNNLGQCDVPASLANAIQVAAGSSDSVALRSDGTIQSWGKMLDGSLQQIPSYVPANLANVVQIQSGFDYKIALQGDGSVAVWGWMWNGSSHFAVPSATDLHGVIQVSAGASHYTVLKADGTVTSRGSNSWGQLNVPSGLSNVVQVSAGAYHSAALKRDGTVVVWGQTNHAGVRQVPDGLTDVVKIAAGDHFTLALKRDGTVVAWGRNQFGEVNVPSGLVGVVDIAASLVAAHALALKADGTVVAWGDNSLGQCNVPEGLAGVLSIAAGGGHSVALFKDSGGLGVVGQPFSQWVDATAAAGLPPELTLDPSTGVVSGIPTAPGLYEVKLTGQDGIERTRFFNILRASESTVTVDIGMVAGRFYTDYFGTTMSGGSFGLGVLPGGADYDFAGKSRDQILSDLVWVNGSRVDGQLVDPANGGQFYLPALFTSFDQNLPMFAFLTTGASVLDGNWLLIGGPDSSWLTPDPENPFGFTAMELSLAGNRIYAGTDGWRYRNGVLVSTGDEDLGFIAPPVVTGGAVEATQGEPFSYQIVATGNPTFFDVSPPLDELGLALDSATGVISGVPSQRGVFDLTLFASNAGWTRSASLQLTVKLGLPVVTSPGPQSAEVGAEFTLQMQASNEATSYAENGLPDGLEIDATTGLISGRPATAGAYTVTVYATNSTGTGETTFSLDVSYDEVSLAAAETSFVVIEKTLTWHQAKADAEALGGRLAVLPTGDLYDRVVAELRQTYSGNVWLGLTDEIEEGVWKWINGAILNYNRWRPGQPDNFLEEDYAHIWTDRVDMNDLPSFHGDWPSFYLLESFSTALAELRPSRGGVAWKVDTSQAHDGVSSAKAQTGDGVETYREYTVTGPVVVDFWWKVSSEQGFDFFSYSVNGELQERISGDVDWNDRSLTFGDGEHTIRWTYAKDEFGAVGQDAGWIDGFATYPATSELEVADGTDVLAGEATVDFGSGGGADLSKTLNFSNKGFVPLAVTLSLPADAPFAFRDTSEKTFELYLGRGEQVPVELVMDTSTIGLKTAVLTIEAPDSTAVAPVLTLIGTALGGEITVTGPAGLINHDQAGEVDFGLAPFEVEFTIANDGNAADLDITNVQVSGNFALTKSPAASVAPGASTTFKVASLDVQPGVQLGVVTIECNDLDTPVFTFPLRSKVLLGTGNPDSGGTETFGTGGAVGWDFAQTELPDLSEGQALKTGTTPDGGASVLQGVFDGPGMLTWNWKVATQQGFDWLTCEVDGVEVAGVSTKNEDWRDQAIRIPAGPTTVRWIYRKDASGTVGQDAGYLAGLAFEEFNGAEADYNQWAGAHGSPASDAKDPKSGLPYVFGWLGGWDPATGPNTNHYRAVREDGVFKYRFPVSKTSTGSARVEFTTDLRFPVPANSWSVRGLEQTVLPGDGDHAVMEVIAPSPMRGFFRLIYSP